MFSLRGSGLELTRVGRWHIKLAVSWSFSCLPANYPVRHRLTVLPSASHQHDRLGSPGIRQQSSPSSGYPDRLRPRNVLELPTPKAALRQSPPAMLTLFSVWLLLMLVIRVLSTHEADSMAVRKSVRCVYPTRHDAPARGLAPLVNSTADMLFPCSSPCGFHLSPLGERSLLWAACSSYGSFIQGDFSAPSPSHLVRDVFGHVSIAITDVVAKYFSLAYHWFPFLDRDAVHGRASQFISGAANHDGFALLLLCMHLFSESPCQHSPHPAQSVLYRTARQLFAVLQTSPDIQLLQCGIILTMYSCGHGLGREAYQTLTICIGLIRRLSFSEYLVAGPTGSVITDYRSQQELDLHWSAIILLDR